MSTTNPNSADFRSAVSSTVKYLYPQEHERVASRIVQLTEQYAARLQGRTVLPLSERTCYLITYADGVRRHGEAPLHTLRDTLAEHVGDAISDIHLLPMFPWTSDDGFGVVDHRQVNPALGSWDDVVDLARSYDLMFDFVANHTSASSPWFRGWLAGDPAYQGYYLVDDYEFDTSLVVRPRTTPLFHCFERPAGGSVAAWTTFGPDQVDVNARTPAALLELTDVLLGYLAKGASTVRLDAIGFLWKESGTSCIHLPRTHTVVQLWRLLVDYVAPGTRLLTETNVPHQENISYFGDGTDEAHMVYQFALPPLVLHSFVSGSTSRLSEWAAGIRPMSPPATWFNFLASHDGIGLRPVEGILNDQERQSLVDRVRQHGGRVSMATRPDGSPTIYELNLSYLEALCTPAEAAEPAVVASKALAAHAILLSVVGVPGIYLHSLVGSAPDYDGMVSSGINRRINREVLNADVLADQLRHDPRRRAVIDGVLHMLRTRREHPAFSPFAPQQVLTLNSRIFAVRRGTGAESVLCLTNVTDQTVALQMSGTDLLTGASHDQVTVGAYSVLWLRGHRKWHSCR